MDIILLILVALWLIFKLFSIIGQDLGGNTEAFKEDVLKEAIPEESKEKEAQVQQEKEKNPIIDVVPTVTSAKTLTLVQDIKNIDSDFDVQQFLQGAILCFKTVIEAFCKGDKQYLKDLLSNKTYKVFEAEIEANIKQERRVVKEVVSIIDAKIDAFTHKAGSLEISVCFTTDQIDVVYDNQDRVLSGHPKDIIRLKDTWVFSRSMKGKKANWYIKETK